MQNHHLILISGTSGSGKSVALNALEDLGYYCIDNLPAILLDEVATKLIDEEQTSKIAISIDSRNKNFLLNIEKSLDELSQHMPMQIIFIDAADEILIKRYSETRRKHPLTNKNTSLVEAITLDRELLTPLQERADIKIDTTKLTPHQLRSEIRGHATTAGKMPITVLFQSFGFKYGSPSDLDFIFDVRCLPNPYWEESLRHMTGLDSQVKTFLRRHETVQIMQQDIQQFVEKWLPAFIADNRTYLNIGIGCTGGKHRSVYISTMLADYFSQQKNIHVQIRHRELNI